MIQSKADYLRFLEADRVALGKKHPRPRFMNDEIWKFQRSLRRLEYYMNCRRDFFSRLFLYYCKLDWQRKGLRLGFTIHPNVFDEGLSIAYPGTIVVNRHCRIGKNCRINVCVNIGKIKGKPGVPQLGNNLYIGPGAALYGDIQIADNIAIGANAAVNKSFLTPNVTIAGVPAKVVSQKGSEDLLFRTET